MLREAGVAGRLNASCVDRVSRVNAGLETDCEGRMEKGRFCFKS